jgi:hypothetical protein
MRAAGSWMLLLSLPEAALLLSFNADYRRRVHAHLLTGVNDTGNY